MGVEEVIRGPSLLAITLPILIMLLYAHICRAMSPVRGNSSTSECCTGDQGEWLVGDIASSEEFLMDSETNRRVLASNPNSISYKTLAKKPAVGCGQGQHYTNCLPTGNKVSRPKPKCYYRNRAGCL